MKVKTKKYSILVVSFAVIFFPHHVELSYPSTSYSTRSYSNQEFLPAKKGRMPSCVKDPRLTFCLEPEKYPKDRIVYLLENKMYDTDTFLQDETRDTYTFEARDAPVIKAMYGQPSLEYNNGYPMSMSHYMPPQNVSTSYNSRRPSKYGSPHHLKPPSSQSAQSFYSVNTTPSLNSFSSSNNKQGPSQGSYSGGRSSSQFRDNEGPYPRYTKNNRFRTTASPYQSPTEHHNWWKKVGQRNKRQVSSATNLCPSRSSYIMPRAAQSVEGDWMFLVNVDERYTQLVKSETCIQNSCEGGCDVPLGFSAICQQQYVQKRLVALDGSGSKLNSDTFWFPSCCICKLRVN